MTTAEQRRYPSLRPSGAPIPPASGKRSRRPRRRLRFGDWKGGWPALLAKLAVGGAIAALLVAFLVFWAFTRDLPSIEQLREYKPPQLTRVLDRHGNLLSEVFKERRTVVPLERIPQSVRYAILAAEDADFYRHRGLDYPGIMRALLRDIVPGGSVQGASTITQQVVKLLLLTPERTLKRKLRELILARRLERQLTKDEILHLYLNHVNFGYGRYGVEEAALFYFDKSISDVTLAEAALLAGLPQAPSRLSPRKNIERAKERRNYVLRQLAAKRERYWPDLRAEDIDAALNEPIVLAAADKREEVAPEVAQLAKGVLESLVGPERATQGGFTIYTTVDAELEAKTREALRKGLQNIDTRQGFIGPLKPPKPSKRKKAEPPRRQHANLRVGGTYNGRVVEANDKENWLALEVEGQRVIADLSDLTRFNPKQLKPSAFAPLGSEAHVSITNRDEDGSMLGRLELGPEGAAIVLEPNSRDVLALVGGSRAVYGFDRATRALRQPGSSFKPIVYAVALQQRKVTPATLIVDAPDVYEGWRPQNIDGLEFKGAVRLREALAGSINMVATRVITMVGPDTVVAFARQLGIQSALEPSLSLALGASAVTPMEMATAYAVFASGGAYLPYRIVTKITAPDGTELPLGDIPAPRPVMTPAEAFVLTSMLQSVVTSGTGGKAQAIGRPAAGKTGTSNDARDAWFVGYTPQRVGVVWVGFDDFRPLGRRESGSAAAVPIWVDVMKAAHEREPVLHFIQPPDVTTAQVDPETGKLAYPGMPNAISEVFLSGTVPSEMASSPDLADPNTFLQEQLGGGAPPTNAASPSASTSSAGPAAPQQQGVAPGPSHTQPNVQHIP